MSIEQPAPGEPRRPHGPRDPGDAWVVAETGERYWGRFGAAGLLAFDPARGILLQHRVTWSHHGDTWALPGGARHEHEPALAAALRESAEEAGVPATAIRPRLMSVLDLGIWSYATIVGDVTVPFEPVISDPESHELAWVAPDDVAGLPLHPGFAASWQRLRPLLDVRPVVVVDAANVIGSVPDGWWKDRAGAAARLLDAAAAASGRGLPASLLGLPEDLWYPELVVVLEGQARSAPDPAGPIRVVRADGPGDDTIAAVTEQLVADGRTVTVATSDRELAERSRGAGASVIGAGGFRDLLGY
ncbi:NUDIX domain-containing protein [Arthrobacter sp. Sa2BUA2]|uniref:NUDIX domain-containing protein n=1 Tax=Arthrobacter pullicola TaxID=2762224 RepID=A0ABR8YH59_9MICC|nr:NUDIX hydrolase [Arthrobacter pullicola]MBD8043463.1 NUDIX domain-containing protein [Arthrobacter pullicola]